MNKIEWREIELRDLCIEISDGNYSSKYPRLEEFIEKGVPFIRANNFSKGVITLEDMRFISIKKHQELQKGHLKEGDVLITTRGDIGNLAIVKKEFHDANINAQIVRLHPNNDIISPEYLFTLLKSPQAKDQIKSNTTGTALKQLPVGKLVKIKLTVPFCNGKPDLREQEKIVLILEKAEKLKERGKNAETLLDEYLKSIFNEMFYDKKFEDKPIKELCEVISGSTPSTSNEEYWNGNIDWITPAELKDGDNYYYFNSERKITEKGLQAISGKLFPKETVMLTTRAPIGKVAIAGKPLCTNQGFKNMVCKKELNPVYLYFWFLLNKDYLNSLGVGATFKEISKRIVENIKILLPPLPIQQKFAKIVKQVEEMKENVRKTKQSSEDLFNSLMQKAFRGEL